MLRSLLRTVGAPRATLKHCTPCMALTSSRLAHTLPDLPYDYNALEPYISADIMKLHHSKHHQTYVTNYNVAEEKLAAAVQAGDTNAIISLQGALKFNGGGHLNHSIFWHNLSPSGGGEPGGNLGSLIKSNFGSFDDFRKQLVANTVAIQGSGWGWLAYNKAEGKLAITTCANQDPLQATTGLIPLLGIDVWEHAYYLQYKNVRPDYVNALFNIINWNDVEARLDAAK